MKLNNAFPDRPQAILSLGPTLDPLRIKEGDDVYFECIITAKPAIYKTTWWFNVSSSCEGKDQKQSFNYGVKGIYPLKSF